MATSVKQYKFRKRFNMGTLYGLWSGIIIWLYSELPHAEAYLELNQTSTMGLFRENSQRVLIVNYFRKKAPSQSFNQALNTPPSYDHGD